MGGHRIFLLWPETLISGGESLIIHSLERPTAVKGQLASIRFSNNPISHPIWLREAVENLLQYSIS